MHFKFLTICIYLQDRFDEPLFYVEDNNLELLALPKHCRKTAVLYNPSTYKEELRTSAVYVPIGDFLPLIFNILSKRCTCDGHKYSLLNGKDAIIF